MTPDEFDKLAQIIGQKALIGQKEILTMDEVALYTGLKKSYLYKLTMRREIPHYKPTGKSCFFKRVELENWLTSNPVATVSDLEAAAQAYCMNHRPYSKK